MPEKKGVVLVIDDTAVRNALKFLLEIAGLNVRLCKSLAATLAMVADGRCSCIVLDERMSAIDAVRLLEELRNQALAIPVIVLSPGLDRDSHYQTVRAGVYRILPFPIVDRSLLDAVLSACGKTTGCAPHT
jgi:two-component system response regulator FixJ